MMNDVVEKNAISEDSLNNGSVIDDMEYEDNRNFEGKVYSELNEMGVLEI